MRVRPPAEAVAVTLPVVTVFGLVVLVVVLTVVDTAREFVTEVAADADRLVRTRAARARAFIVFCGGYGGSAFGGKGGGGNRRGPVTIWGKGYGTCPYRAARWGHLLTVRGCRA
ncbi:hypothetical protein llg_25290 [Luteolibacter sp. LG18]|nr:hypothetical protein llg_25290 [Luteolibacter sp. LG18]